MNYALIGRLTEKVSGVVIVEIIDANSNEVLERAEQSLELLAPNEVRFEPGNDEVFAAFVLPSDPFVSEVLREARRILGERTGNTSTQGYQAGHVRVNEIAHAIYDAMSSFKYSYSNPHGYFEHAQKVRTPSQVKNENCGTCLDTTVLMAACFAQAGLEPVLFLVEQHAFAGYFTGKRIDSDMSIDSSIRILTNRWGSVLNRQNNFGAIFDSKR
jgi:hypothetical protein